MTRVAIVTGGNKGIGYATCRALAKKFDGGDVFLTARSAERGNAAVADLEKEGCTVKFHQLDIDDVASIEKASGMHYMSDTNTCNLMVINTVRDYDIFPISSSDICAIRFDMSKIYT